MYKKDIAFHEDLHDSGDPQLMNLLLDRTWVQEFIKYNEKKFNWKNEGKVKT